MDCSFEWLEALAAGATRSRARLVLQLSQAGAAKWDADAWKEVQQQLKDQLETGL